MEAQLRRTGAIHYKLEVNSKKSFSLAKNKKSIENHS